MEKLMLAVFLGGSLGVEPAPVEAPSAALPVVEELDRMAARALWPGFDPLAVPLALYDGRRTYLFRHPDPPEEFAATGASPDVRVYEGRHESIRANTSIDLGGVPTATLILGGGDRSARDWAAVAAHECFHVFQREHHPSWQANEADLFLYPVDDAELLHLRRLESEALRRALEAEEPAVAASWAMGALELRRERFGRLGESFVAYERGTELNEGLAQYVESLARGDGAAGGFPDEEFAPNEVRRRGYASGRALALLLDRFRPGWKESLEEDGSRSVDGLLAQALAELPGGAARFDAAERQAALLDAREDVAALAEERRARREGFLSQSGWTLVLEAEGDEPLWPEGFDPLNVLLVGEGEVLHTRFVKLSNSLGKVEVLDRAALSEGVGPHPLFNGVRRLTVTGLPAEPAVREVDGATSIQAEGLEARFAGAEIEEAADTILVRVSRPGSAD